MNEKPVQTEDRIERYDYAGRAHPGGVPHYERGMTHKVWPQFIEGQNKVFEFSAEIEEIDYQFRLEPYQSVDEPTPKGFVFSRVLARIPDGRPEDSEEPQPWSLIDEHALIPQDEDKLLKVFKELVANPEEADDKQKGIRSHELWSFLRRNAGRAAVAGAVISMSGIIVYRHKHKKS